MFSGIIERQGLVARLDHGPDRLELELDTGFTDLALGESVAVNGICLTVTTFDAQGKARFFASAETLARTNLGSLAVGDRVNLERAVALATRLSGHMVQGHVDGMARMESITETAGAWVLTLVLPPALGRYCVLKGSIALDGISLTLNGVEDIDQGTRISLTIIPHTWTHTNLSTRRAGDLINVESDIIAKYVERLCTPSPKP